MSFQARNTFVHFRAQIKVPLLWFIKVFFGGGGGGGGGGLGVPNNRLTYMQGKKNFHFLIIYNLFFTLFAQRLLNDWFFQTPSLRDANLQWLVRLVDFI